MKRKTSYMKNLVLTLTLLTLSACGGGGGGGGGLETPSTNLSGTWKISESLVSNDCGEVNGISIQQNLKVVQDGNNITVTDDQGNVFKGTISGNQVSWSGSYPEDGGTTTITNLSLTVSKDGKNLSGTSSWTWTDGSSGCQGKTTFSGSLSSSSGSNGIRNVAGTWLISETIKTSPCSFSTQTVTYQVLITQNGASIAVTASFGNWEGTITGSTVSWGGVSNNVTRKNMSLTLSADGGNLVGTLDEEIILSNPVRFCPAETSLTGTKV